MQNLPPSLLGWLAQMMATSQQPAPRPSAPVAGPQGAPPQPFHPGFSPVPASHATAMPQGTNPGQPMMPFMGGRPEAASAATAGAGPLMAQPQIAALLGLHNNAPPPAPAQMAQGGPPMPPPRPADLGGMMTVQNPNAPMPPPRPAGLLGGGDDSFAKWLAANNRQAMSVQSPGISTQV